jgi:hypothetical protein
MPEEESSVERIKKILSKRDAGSQVHARRKLHGSGESHEVRNAWGDDTYTGPSHAASPEEESAHVLEALRSGRLPDQDPLAEALHRAEQNPYAVKERTERKLAFRFIRTLFIASAAFFLITGGIASYFLLYGGREVKCENITLDVRGPASIPSGKELVLNASVLNQNIVPIEGVEIVFEYPEGTRSPQNSTVPLPSQREQIGTIDSGERVRTTGRAILFGQEQTEHTISTRVEFTVKDSNASFRCETPFTIALATAPISVAVTGLEEISSGQELVLTVEVRSNSEELVRDARLVATYPYGFDFLSADPKPTTKESVWDIGDVGPGTVRTYTIRGKVSGYGSEGRSVDFALGEASPQDDGELGIILQTVQHSFLLTKPFLATTLRLNDSESGDYSIPLGEIVSGTLTWTNDGQEALHDVELSARLPGVIVDRRSVSVKKGFFQSVDGTMIWTPQTEEALRVVEPGESGTVSFSFETTPFIESTAATDPFINIAFDIRARRIADNIPVEQALTDQSQRTINFTTDATLNAYALYGVGPFTNTGPHPPRVDEETSYTITFKLKNTTSDLEDVSVVGELPVYVTWVNMTAPVSENISFNPVTRKVTWSVGDLPAGTGYRTAAREASFQIAVIPSITQEGNRINLFEDVTFTGVDAFTGSVVQRENRDITTQLLNDPFFPKDEGDVRE